MIHNSAGLGRYSPLPLLSIQFLTLSLSRDPVPVPFKPLERFPLISVEPRSIQMLNLDR